MAGRDDEKVVDLDVDIFRNRTPSGWPTQSQPPTLEVEMNGRRYRIRQGKTEEGLQVLLWPIARLLTRYIELHEEKFRGARVLELGAGVGLTGIGAAAYGADVLLTDKDIRLTEINTRLANEVSFPSGGSARAEVLDWHDGDAFVAAHRTGADPRPFRWVIGSDIVYHQQHDFRHIQALARLLSRLEGPETTILFGYQERDVEAKNRFFDALRAEGLEPHERSLDDLEEEGVATEGFNGPMVFWTIAWAPGAAAPAGAGAGADAGGPGRPGDLAPAGAEAEEKG